LLLLLFLNNGKILNQKKIREDEGEIVLIEFRQLFTSLTLN